MLKDRTTESRICICSWCGHVNLQTDDAWKQYKATI